MNKFEQICVRYRIPADLDVLSYINIPKDATEEQLKEMLSEDIGAIIEECNKDPFPLINKIWAYSDDLTECSIIDSDDPAHQDRVGKIYEL